MIKGKNIVVTGSLQGIGKETVSLFAQHGANVFACSYKEDEQFKEFCADLSSKYEVKVEPIYFDMMDNDAVKEAAKTIHKYKVQIDGLVNIAGINKDAFFNMITYQDMLDTFQVNFFSQIIFSQYIAKMMQRNNSGSIVFTSSITAMDGNEGQTVYGASKAALIGAMKSMALELGKNNIRVNAVAPGVIKTPMTDKLDESLIESKVKCMDIPHIGEMTDVANLYMYLMSDLSSHVTGQTIRIDGGMC